MKKLIVVLTVAALCATGAFALDLGSVKGTWQDSKWDANWTFGAAGTIELTLASRALAELKGVAKTIPN
ncbi:MAG: hypothetical protein K6B73_07560 [Treponema sp.]|nr:hypothetical protein [Treponema sp.]